jgi:DNA-binding CsgD family transcriptional regulator
MYRHWNSCWNTADNGSWAPGARAGKRLLESLSCAVGVCAGDGRLLHKNTALRNWLRLRDGLQDVHGRFELMLPEEDSHWLELIAGCGQSRNVMPLATWDVMRITRPSGKPAYVLQLQPLLYEVVDCPAADDAVALMRIIDPAAAPSGHHDILQQLYCLSAAEMRLLERLLEGEKIKQAAYHLQISEHTARSELKSIFTKTGTHRQAQLMRLVMSLAMG